MKMNDAASWDEALIKAWIEEAAETLRRLPRGYVKPRVTYWPDVVQNGVHSFGSSRFSNKLAAPSPRSIDRMERVLGWLFHCDDDSRRIVWARACGIPWRRLEDVDGRSHVTLRKVVDRGISDIQRHLRRNPREVWRQDNSRKP
ncbi:MAG: hypothetical protein ISP41_00445 [Alphaproteobacteria bacterium]|nr:hypothetical protein [Alphaproteobacteria bacterium]